MPLLVGCKINFVNESGKSDCSYHYPGKLSHTRISTPGDEFNSEDINYIKNLVDRHNNEKIKITSIEAEGHVKPKTWVIADKINSDAIISDITLYLLNNKTTHKPRGPW